jgi:hypothetical protein
MSENVWFRAPSGRFRGEMQNAGLLLTHIGAWLNIPAVLLAALVPVAVNLPDPAREQTVEINPYHIIPVPQPFTV